MHHDTTTQGKEREHNFIHVLLEKEHNFIHILLFTRKYEIPKNLF